MTFAARPVDRVSRFHEILSPKAKAGISEAVEKEHDRLRSRTFDVFYGPVYDNEGKLRVAEGESMTDNDMLNEFDWYVEGVVSDE